MTTWEEGKSNRCQSGFFKRLYGVKPDTFEKMRSILQKEKVCRYIQRWKIEWFHYVLKSGCAVEKLQKRTAVYFEEAEWGLLYRAANKTKKMPRKPYAIGEAVSYLGQLGGPKRAPSGGLPGVKTIWAGLTTLNTLLAYLGWLS